jgi:hypothetical protein|eukprot:COSAG01_NODE_1585_length_9810_cov_8.980435_5_plen_57_part_00
MWVGRARSFGAYLATGRLQLEVCLFLVGYWVAVPRVLHPLRPNGAAAARGVAAGRD